MKIILCIYLFLFGSFISAQTQTIILSEDFEGGVLPLGWTLQQETGSTGWQVGNSSALSSSSFNIPGHGLFATSNDDLCNCDMSNDLLISPSINLNNTYMSKLMFSVFYTGGNNSKASILVSTNGTTWSVLEQIPANSNWTTHTVDLSLYVGQPSLQIAFKHDDNGGHASGIAIDDVVITAPTFIGNTILFEGFNSCSLPLGWGKFELNGAIGFEIATADSISGNGLNIPPACGCIAGVNDLKHDGATVNDVDDYLHTPALDFSNYSSVFLDFDAWDLLNRRFYMTAIISTDSINWQTLNGAYSRVGWTSFKVDLTQWAGEPKVYVGFKANDYSFTYNQGGGAVDNIHIYEPPARDVKLVSVSPHQYVDLSKTPIRGKIKNLGGDTIHTVNVHWQVNNGIVHSETLTGLNYIPLSTNNFELNNDSIQLNTTGIHDLKIWLSSPNGLADMNPVNDSIIKTIDVLPYLPSKRVVLEEFTATWCTSCPTSASAITAFSAEYPEAIIVAFHSSGSDIMNYVDASILAGNLQLGGYPSLYIDRLFQVNPYSKEKITKGYLDRRDFIDPVEVTFLQKSYNAITRELTVEVNAEFFVDYPNDDLRFNVTITEDSISNQFNSNYNQANAPHFPYYHRHVARANLDGVWGVQGSLPSSIAAGNYSKLFTWMVPDSFNLDHLEIIGMVQRSPNSHDRAILNANTISFNAPLTTTSIRQTSHPTTPNINVYPNPFSNNLIVTFNLEKATDIAIEITDLIGQSIGRFSSKEMSSGRQLIHMENYINNALLQEGIYFINIQLGNKQFTKELIYQK